MPKVFWKNFHLCFSTFKCLPPPLPCPPPPSVQPPNNTTTLSPISTLIRNFNSVYELTSSDSKAFTDDTFSSSSDADDSDAAVAPLNLSSVYASRRFFFSSPGRSNSIMDSSPSTPQPEANLLPPPLAGWVTVHKFSSDPYADFHRSMQEMFEEREPLDSRSDWEYLHELLLCYLALNPKHTHKFIVGAFSDIVVLLMSQPPTTSAGHRTTN